MMECIANGGLGVRFLKQSSNKGDIPVCHQLFSVYCVHLQNHAFWEWSAKKGGKSHVKINKSLRPLVNKYLEGKMKRTLKRELKEFEFAEWKASKRH